MKINWRFLIYPLVSLLVLLIDQWIKQSIRVLPMQEVFFTIPGILELTHSTNTGAAFSVLAGHTNVIAIISVVLLIALLILLNRTMHLTICSNVLLSVLFGAGVGNLIDRILFGGVTDYIRLLFIRFPIFNFADICITCSVIVLSVFIMTGRLDGQPEELSHGSND